ncbi:hypothetical protein BDZ94DRAFT_1260504 [Collybia nuda]|uniref:Uncharacterized protein n=1 Tax=Collybia nuda TaxID=64659 RepID=A0A9P6CJA6_9AGAR|nr:hypothetical protein BDZ94DRAFT_1260504 [Collybia nuda]
MECLKYNLSDDGLAQNMVFCKLATCHDYRYSSCTGGQVLSVKIPVIPGTVVLNALNWYSLFGKSGTFLRSGL